jgi:SAM-dependent methyltransferase
VLWLILSPVHFIAVCFTKTTCILMESVPGWGQLSGMTDNRTIWEETYRRQKYLWGGSVPELPSLPHHARVLELGCGNGKTFAALLRNGWDAVALDFSKTAVKTARSQITLDQSGDCIVADARSIPFRAASFDAVFSWHILGHLTGQDRIQVAERIGSLLKPGGIVLFSEFSRDDFRCNKGTLLEEGTFLRGNSISTHYFTEDEVRKLFISLPCISLITRQWEMKGRGTNYVRSEIQAVFSTPCR